MQLHLERRSPSKPSWAQLAEGSGALVVLFPYRACSAGRQLRGWGGPLSLLPGYLHPVWEKSESALFSFSLSLLSVSFFISFMFLCSSPGSVSHSRCWSGAFLPPPPGLLEGKLHLNILGLRDSRRSLAGWAFSSLQAGPLPAERPSSPCLGPPAMSGFWSCCGQAGGVWCLDRFCMAGANPGCGGRSEHFLGVSTSQCGENALEAHSLSWSSNLL